MTEMTYVRPGSEFLGATETRHPITGALMVELVFAHPTHPQTIQIDYYVWHASRIRVEPVGWLEPVPPGPLTCHNCGFVAPALYDEPSGRRLCGTCKAEVSDGPARPAFDPADPAGGA